LSKDEFAKLDAESDEKRIIESIGARFIDYLEDRSQIIPYHCERIESFKFLQNNKPNGAE